MEIENEITKYLAAQTDKSTEDTFNFLVKVWNSQSLKSPSKFDAITKYVVRNLLQAAFDDGAVSSQHLVRLFKQKLPTNGISEGTWEDLTTSLTNLLSANPSLQSAMLTLEMISTENMKEFLKSNLKVYFKLHSVILTTYNSLAVQGQPEQELFDNIITELYCFAKVNNFKQLLIKTVLAPLMEASKTTSVINNKAALDLLKAIFFSKLSSEENLQNIFITEGTKNSPQTRDFLIDIFIALNKKNAEEVGNLLATLDDKVLSKCGDDVEFLTEIKKFFGHLKSNDVDLGPMKRKQSELFERLSARIVDATNLCNETMNFGDFLDLLSSLISCDPFLFEKNIYALFVDCMLREKSSIELGSFEKLFSVVLKIYGKDMHQFLKKLFKAMEVKMENFKLPKKRKRKQASGSESESTPKKSKLASGEEPKPDTEWSHILHIWPASISVTFAEIVSGFNITLGLKVLKQINGFIVDVLKNLKESQEINENVLMKIDLASCLLSEYFINARIHEQIMSKQNEVTVALKEFSDTQKLFYETILNIEYNSRVMNAFLKVSGSFESFLMLYFYNYDVNAKSEMDQVFIGNQKSEWKIIQQRVKNFGKLDEQNSLNLLMIQQQQKELLFNNATTKFDDLTSIVTDEKQVDFILQRPDTRYLFINALEDKDVECFAQQIMKFENGNSQSLALNAVASNQSFLEKFISKIIVNDSQENILNILNQLPLICVSEDSKKHIFEKILQFDVEEHQMLLESVISKLLDADSYKSLLKDFSMDQILKKFADVKKFSSMYQCILSTAARKANSEIIESLEKILKSKNKDLIKILAKTISEAPLPSLKNAAGDSLKQFKLHLIQEVIQSLKKSSWKNITATECDDFFVLVRLVNDNSSALNEDMKLQCVELLEKLIKSITSTPDNDRIKLLMTILKDSKKLNLKDETKTTIVDALFVYLKSLLLQKMSSEGGASLDVNLETQLFETLKSFKSNFMEGSLHILRKTLNEKSSCTEGHLLYSFKIYQVAFNNLDKQSAAVLKDYAKFYDDFVSKALTLQSPELTIQILETNNLILKDAKIQLENTTIDEFLCLLGNPTIKPAEFSIEDFFKYYSAVGEALFVVANIRQNYFKSRVSQYFIVYKTLMDGVYFYKNDQPEDLNPLEISLLLKLALQLENIIKMIMKMHSKAINIISPYVVSSIVNIFVKNPKTFSLGLKFKVNIKNICYQLLSTFEDKTRKHVYSVVDETTREVYDGLFSELRRRV